MALAPTLNDGRVNPSTAEAAHCRAILPCGGGSHTNARATGSEMTRCVGIGGERPRRLYIIAFFAISLSMAR